VSHNPKLSEFKANIESFIFAAIGDLGRSS